jgi:hypothetical protein
VGRSAADPAVGVAEEKIASLAYGRSFCLRKGHYGDDWPPLNLAQILLGTQIARFAKGTDRGTEQGLNEIQVAVVQRSYGRATFRSFPLTPSQLTSHGLSDRNSAKPSLPLKMLNQTKIKSRLRHQLEDPRFRKAFPWPSSSLLGLTEPNENQELAKNRTVVFP